MTAGGRENLVVMLLAVLCLLFACVATAAAQQAIVEVRFPQLDASAVVRGQLNENGVLTLPTAPLEELTGEDLGQSDAISLPTLQQQLGAGVRVTYDPRRATLTIADPYALLAATRARREARRNVSRAAAGANAMSGGAGGPWAALVADDRGEAFLEAGWGVGPVAISGGHSTIGDRTSWGASLQPLARTWISYRDGNETDPRLSLRTAAGPVFASVRTEPGEPWETLDGRAALTLGHLTAFGTTDGSAALGYTGRELTITAGWNGREDRSVVRIGFGRRISALSIPRVR